MHEEKLAFEIMHHHLLSDPSKVLALVQQYSGTEKAIAHNEFKEAQINYLAQQFQGRFNGIIYHIDDSIDVCEKLNETFQALRHDNNVQVHTLSYHHAPLFYNESCITMLNDIGLLEDWDIFLRHEGQAWDDHEPLYLALCLFATQVHDTDRDFLAQLAAQLQKFQAHAQAKNIPLCIMILALIDRILETGQSVHFYLNEWVTL